MALNSATLQRQQTELSLGSGSYDSAIEDAQNPNPSMDELLAAKAMMPPPKTSPKRALSAAKTPSPKKVCEKKPEPTGNQGEIGTPSPSEPLQEGLSPGPSLSDRPAPAQKAKRGKSPTYWRPDLKSHEL